MTPREVLDVARHIMQDRDNSDYRQNNAELLTYLKEGVALAMIARPDLFGTDYEHICAVGPYQSIPSVQAQLLIEVKQIKGGSMLTRMTKRVLDVFSPAWVSATTAAALQWDKDESSPLGFWVYPPAAADQRLITRVVPQPPTYDEAGLDADMGMPEWVRIPLASFVVGRSEFKDDEHVNSGRAAAMTAQFTDTIKAGA